MSDTQIKSEVMVKCLAQPWSYFGKRNTFAKRMCSLVRPDQIKKLFLLNLLLSLLAIRVTAQRAELHVFNNSSGQLTVKIMYQNGKNFSQMQIRPLAHSTAYFEQTGEYFLKIRASLPAKEVLYKKGEPFRVYVGSRGYSVLTITYSIFESDASSIMDGEKISREEFERDEFHSFNNIKYYSFTI